MLCDGKFSLASAAAAFFSFSKTPVVGSVVIQFGPVLRVASPSMWLVRIVVVAWASVALALDRVTVLIVLDGFRHDYLNATFHAPNLLALSSSGVLVPRLKPVFPAFKLANLASLITGAYSEEHNVIDDHEVFDAQLKRVVNESEARFWSGVRELGSIWVRFLHKCAQNV